MHVHLPCVKIRLTIRINPPICRLMEQTLREQLLFLANGYATATGVSEKTIGKRAINDNTFFDRLAEGNGFTVKTYDRVVRWLSANWPRDLKWPTHIDRPAPSATGEAA